MTDSESVKFKAKITRSTLNNNGSTKDNEIALPLKHLCNFWRILEMPLINCKTNLILTGSADCVISAATGETKLQ